MRFAIDATGTVLSVQLVRSSEMSALDEAVAMVRRASPMWPPPGVPRDLTVPVQFAVR